MFVIGFSRPNSKLSVLSWIIRAVEKREFSHVYIRFIASNVNVVCQASNGMVNLMALSEFQKKNKIVEEFVINCDAAAAQNVFRFIYMHLGVNYSYLQLLLILIKKITLQEIKYVNSEFICSEWAAQLLQLMGKSVDGNLQYKTPSDLYALLHQIKNEANNG